MIYGIVKRLKHAVNPIIKPKKCVYERGTRHLIAKKLNYETKKFL